MAYCADEVTIGTLRRNGQLALCNGDRNESSSISQQIDKPYLSLDVSLIAQLSFKRIDLVIDLQLG